MSSFHLRPVADNSPSPSPTSSTTPPGNHSLPLKGPSSAVVLPSPTTSNLTNGRTRRPLSPSSLRDVDLTHTPDMQPRKYPAPPTGHDLMAMFPPAPPDNFPEMRPGPTSGFFQRQERAFFAQAGKEIVRVRVEVDLPTAGESPDVVVKSRGRDSTGPRHWSAPGHSQPIPAHHHSPVQSSPSAPLLYPHPSTRPSPRGGPVPVTTAPLYPIAGHNQPAQLPPNLHPPPLHQPGIGLRTSPHDPTQPGAPSTKMEFQSEEFDDEAWRRPMPYAERRRAGKHTRRVIVRT